jgi:hypothetical protein
MNNVMIYCGGQYHGPFTKEDAVLFMSHVSEEPRLFELVERPVNVTYSCVVKAVPEQSTSASPQPVPSTIPSGPLNKRSRKNSKGTFG